MLKKFGLQYNPDLVILGFFMGNDFVDADPYRKRIAFNNAYADIDKRHEHRILGYPFVFPFRSFGLWSKNGQILAESRRARMDTQTSSSRNLFLREHLSQHRKESGLDLFDANSFRSTSPYQRNINYIFERISEMDDLLKGW